MIAISVTNGYCTVAEIRDQLSDTGSLIDTDLLEKAINATSRAIDRFCGRRFWRDATVTSRVYRCEEPYLVWTDDISTATGLIVKTDTTGDGTYATTWASTDYQLEPLNSEVVASGDTVTPFAWWRITAIDRYTFPIHAYRPTLQVTARFGWSAIPDEVNEAAIIKAVSLFRRKDAPHGVAGFNEWGMIRISSKDPDVWDLLNPYRRLHTAGV